MGAVYLCDDSEKGCRVAVKSMRRNPDDGSGGRNNWELFHGEFALLKGLSHPKIPKVIEFFQEEGDLYLVMEYMPGLSLQAVMEERDSPMSQKETLDIALQVLDTLIYLHSRTPPVIFRDLKPENLIMNDKGELSLVDFGVAGHYLPGNPGDRVRLATMGYAAPEQCGHVGRSEPRSDLYALGAMMHFLLTGNDPKDHPFEFEPLISAVPYPLSPDLEKTVARSLEREPEKRFPSAAALREVLLCIRDGKQAAPPEQARGWVDGIKKMFGK